MCKVQVSKLHSLFVCLLMLHHVCEFVLARMSSLSPNLGALSKFREL